MDPVTHFLTGACLGRSGFNRKSALATATMVLAAEAADVDIIWSLKGSIAGLQHHRGITHSFVGVPFVAAAVLGLVWLWHRFRQRKNPDKARVTRKSTHTMGFSLLLRRRCRPEPLATRLHHGLRHPPVRAVQLPLVFVGHRLHRRAADAAGADRRAGDPGVTRPNQPGDRRRSKGPRGRTGATLALVCVVIIWGVRDFQHRRAVTAMDSMVYNQAEPLRVAAIHT